MVYSGSKTYKDAINLLNSLQSNAAVIEQIRLGNGKSDAEKVKESLEYVKRLGYEPPHLNPLNVLHITGTKGKGSTSAFTSSLLRSVAPGARIGLYTSPHLVAVRERIRINGKPLEEELFAKYFFDVWEKWEKTQDTIATPDSTPVHPAYFRYLTFMAFHVFLAEKVDATILEVGVGGTYDSTNLVPKPITTGITALGIDHVFVLGHTLKEIAWQKGGIYKSGVPAFAVENPEEGLSMLKSRAQELGAASFEVVPVDPGMSTFKLGLEGPHQRQNASLAVALVKSFLASADRPPAFPASASPQAITKGLEEASWPGRCQRVGDAKVGNLEWFLDGAHTSESLTVCGDWFKGVSKRKRALIFNCTSGRSGPTLLGALLDAIAGEGADFEKVIFCTNTTYSSGNSASDLTSNSVDPNDLASLQTQNDLAAAWRGLAKTHESVLPSIEDAVNSVRELEGEWDVLVTGSLHLVGGVMQVAGVGLDA
ncbi:FolC bifunctional protein [Meredithblackwellia eburnea MCA 4105]